MPSASTLTPKAQLATFFDLLVIPEESRRHEILEGEIIEKALPRGEHGFSQGNIVMQLRDYQRRQGEASKPGGWWFATEPTIELSRHGVVQPDVAGWLRERMPSSPSAAMSSSSPPPAKTASTPPPSTSSSYKSASSSAMTRSSGPP